MSNKEKERVVYVVDDSKIIAHIVTHTISQMPHTRAYHFQSGEAMLAQLEKRVPDLIFLDYYLDTQSREHMNGGQVMDHVRKKFPDLKIVLLTGMNDRVRAEELRTKGFDDVLHKDNDDILKDVVECVNRNLPA